MKKANCGFCIHNKKYHGVPWCCLTPGHPTMLVGYPEDCSSSISRSDYHHNCSVKANTRQKADIQELENTRIVPGQCDQGCIYWLKHLNYCTAFDMKCSGDGWEEHCPYEAKVSDNS